MPDYVIFGGCLRSDLPFPELHEVRGRVPTWTLRVGRVERDDRGSEVVSDTTLSPSCRVRLTRREGRWCYEHSCTGRFELSADGREIVFEPATGGSIEVARTDLVARVLLLGIERPGVAWLHGSAVACGGRALAFVAPSGAGKSTLALALARAGAVHVCDDTLPIEAGPPPVIWPSDHTLRLRDDTRAAFAASMHAVLRESDGKHVLTHRALASHAATQEERTHAPLDAIYVLRPVPAIEGAPAPSTARRRLGAAAAVAALLPHVKLGPVLTREAPARMLGEMAAIADAVPVFELRVPRAWELLDAVTSQIFAWHPLGAPHDGAAAAGGTT